MNPKPESESAMRTIKRGLRASVYVDRNNPKGCTNGGISSRHSRFVLLDADGSVEPDDDCPALYLIKDANGIAGNTIAKPSLTDGKWYMFGGNFIYSSDSRFPGHRPIPIHDRTETYIPLRGYFD